MKAFVNYDKNFVAMKFVKTDKSKVFSKWSDFKINLSFEFFIFFIYMDYWNCLFVFGVYNMVYKK